jgi:hypothetical protein
MPYDGSVSRPPEGDGLSEMSDSDAQAEDLDHILRLVTALAENLTAPDIANDSVHPERLRVLISAAQFLHDHDVPWPPVVHATMDTILKRMEAIRGG